MSHVPERGRGRIFCGPYALAVINGLSCDEANEAVKRSLRKRRMVRGMYSEEVERVSRGKFMKHPLKFKKVRKGITLQSLPDHLKPRRLYMVFTSTHYVVIKTSDLTVCDTYSRAWVPLREHPFRLARIRSVAEGPRIDE